MVKWFKKHFLMTLIYASGLIRMNYGMNIIGYIIEINIGRELIELVSADNYFINLFILHMLWSVACLFSSIL